MKTLSYFGTGTSIIGAFLMAFGFVLMGYIFFSLGSVSWLIVGINRRDKPLIILNATFFCANIIGLLRAIL